ncbi:DUF167 domain-containing protein [bacterium]|nr:DUF167 domain-containing protein [bacterium]MBQ6436360.1 DUF167 domain-containing protein [bacterium]
MTQLDITLTPAASHDHVVATGASSYHVYTTKPARDNAANLALIKLLAKHLHLPKSKIILSSGAKSRHKKVTVLD